MASYILDVAYRIERDGGVGAFLVVVPNRLEGEAVLPKESPLYYSPPLGVTVHSQAVPGANVAVRKAGIAKVIAESPFSIGEPLFYTLEGKVCNKERYKNLFPLHKWAWCLGFAETEAIDANDIAQVFISIHQFHFLSQSL